MRKLTRLFFAAGLAALALLPMRAGAGPRPYYVCVSDCRECPAYCYWWICEDTLFCEETGGIACRCF